MAIDGEEVRRIAALAQLDLDPTTLRELAGELEAILDYVQRIDELELDAVEPTPGLHAHVGPARADEEQPSLTVDEALGNAPDRSAGHFRVARVL